MMTKRELVAASIFVFSSGCFRTVSSPVKSVTKDDVDKYHVEQFPELPPAEPGERQVGALVTYIRQGQQAPYSGALLSRDATAKLVAELKNQKEQCDIRVQKEVETQKSIDKLNYDMLALQCDSEKKRDEIMLSARDDTIKMLTERLEETSDPNTEVWFGVGLGGGLLVGIAATIGIAYAVKDASQ